MNDDLIRIIDELPPLPKTILDIQRICKDPEASIGDLVKAVENDPMITANILKAVNSPAYGIQREVKNITQAVSLFGLELTNTIGVGEAARDMLPQNMDAYGINQRVLRDIASAQSSFVSKWFKKIDRDLSEKLFFAAFLQEIGKMIISSILAKNNTADEFRGKIQDSKTFLIEEGYIGKTSTEVSVEIFARWGLDKDMIDLLKISSEIERGEIEGDINVGAGALYLSRILASEKGIFSDGQIEKAFIAINELELHSSLLEETIFEIRNQLRK